MPATTDGRNMTGDSYPLATSGSRLGPGGSSVPLPRPSCPRPKAASIDSRLMPGRTDERAALGDTTFDIYLNDRAYWRNVPAVVWRYKLGGYQVLKKWLSYRERNILGRPLKPEEVQHFTDTARRIAAVLLLTNTTE